MMFSHQINKSCIIDDCYALDQSSFTQAPGGNIGSEGVKGKIFHPAGNLSSVGGFAQGCVHAVLNQQDRTPGPGQAKATIQSGSLEWRFID